MHIQKWLMQWQRKKIFVKHRQKKDSCEECTQWQQRTINIKGQRKCRVLLIKIKNSLEILQVKRSNQGAPSVWIELKWWDDAGCTVTQMREFLKEYFRDLCGMTCQRMVLNKHYTC